MVVWTKKKLGFYYYYHYYLFDQSETYNEYNNHIIHRKQLEESGEEREREGYNLLVRDDKSN